MGLNKKLITGNMLAAALLLTACGGHDPANRKADPLTDFQDLRADVAPANFKPADQNFDGLLFDLRVDGMSEAQSQLNFFEGKAATFRIRSRVFIPEVNYTLVPHGLPTGATFSQSKDEAGVYLLSWNPVRGTIANGLDSQKIDLQIEFRVEANTSARAKEILANDKRNRLKSLTLNVAFAQTQPTVKLVGIDKEEYKVGDVVPFTVEVSDVNSNKDRRPDVMVTYDPNNLTNEAKFFPAASAVLVNYERRPEFKGNGRWVYHFILDTTLIPAKFLSSGSKFAGGEFIVYSFNPSSKMDSSRLIKRIQFKSEPVVSDAAPVKKSAAPKAKKSEPAVAATVQE